MESGTLRIFVIKHSREHKRARPWILILIHGDIVELGKLVKYLFCWIISKTAVDGSLKIARKCWKLSRSDSICGRISL